MAQLLDKSMEDGSKKTLFEDLSKDELLKKCKGLLVIAQKAKQTKTELTAEISSLKEQYEKINVQKSADKESLKMMQEFVETLTEQKLSLTSQIDTLKRQNHQLRATCKQNEADIEKMIASHEEQIQRLRSEVLLATGNISDMDTEIMSLKRQKGRLEKENEELMEQMTDFENRIKILSDENVEQKNKIIELGNLLKCQESLDIQLVTTNETVEDKSGGDDVITGQVVEDKVESVKTSSSKMKSLDLDHLEKQLDSVRNELNSKTKSLYELENTFSQKDEALKESIKNYEAEKVKTDRLNGKLKQYRDKIIKCSSSITQLKNSKFVLLKTVSEYSESVPKWQKDIINASNLLSEQLLALEAENVELKKKMSSEPKSENSHNSNIDLMSQLESLKCDYDNVLLNLQSLESEKLILVNEKQVARDAIHKTEVERNELQANYDELNSKLVNLNAKVCTLNRDLELLEIKNSDLVKELEATKLHSTSSKNAVMKELNEEVSLLKHSLVSIEEENKLLIEANDLLKSKVDELTSATNEINPEVVDQNIMLQADISKLETKMTAYKTENASLLFDLKESRQRLSELDNVTKELDEVKTKLANYKSENMELLSEMKEINQVLKERGETISRQDMEISESNRKLQHLEDEMKKVMDEKESKVVEINSLKDTLKEKECRLKMVNSYKESMKSSDESLDALKVERDNLKSLLDERDSIIVSLNEDLDKIKENQNNICFDAPSENLSISTTSKIEESSRLKDLDESFEERYAKLRTLALKLKKRVGELTTQVKSLEDEKASWGRGKNKSETSNIGSKNMQSMQIEYDKLVDKMEQKDVELKKRDKLCQELRAEVDKCNQNLMDAEDRHAKLEKEFEFLKKEKSAIDMALKECHGQIAAMKKDCEILSERDAEILKLKADLAAKDAQILTETTAHQTTKEALEKTKKDVKKKSVLSLEMEDYERSMKDLTAKMEDNKKKLVQMESTIDTQEGTIQSLRTQIKMLEDQLNSEERVVRETKELLLIATENLKEKEMIICSKQDEVSQLERKLEEAKLKNEDVNLQLASALGEKEKVALNLGQEKMELNTRLKRCELLCNEVEEKLKLKELELNDIKTEFCNYKVRAQNVLRQNQTKDVSVEENLKEEMIALKAELEALKPELQLTKEELESVLSDRARLASRCSELQSTLQTERELANTQIQRDVHEYNSLKIQMSTLTQCYKKQISDLEERTTEEISNLRQELEFLRISLERANALTKDQALALEKKRAMQVSNVLNSSLDSTNSNTGLMDINDNSGDTFNVALLEREEGEGSESTPSPSPTYMSRSAANHKQNIFRKISSGSDSKRREPVPLEQLLEGDIPEECYIEGDVESRLETALRQIESQEKRLAHMTEIIAEAEKEVARRTQLGEALKEEVRRYERQLERTLHHHNQEYLKNVIIKFLTLSAGDERSRLVPVLHTILTLSPEETHQLTAVAKGVDPNTGRGWGSYIPWPGKS